MPEADPRFKQGLELFNAGEWYAAHDLFDLSLVEIDTWAKLRHGHGRS